MFSAYLASLTVLSLQAAAHDADKCSCGVAVVTSYTGIVLGPDDAWGGMRPHVRLIPDRVEFRPCPHARMTAGRLKR